MPSPPISLSDKPPENCLPAWGTDDLPEPKPLAWRNWRNFIGPGVVMMGVQIGGGEWLFGPEITNRYGGALMWIATVAIVLQVFYNIECGRYAMYCGEPVMTGFARTRPGPRFWVGVLMLLGMGALIPALSTHAGAIIAALQLGRPPSAADAPLITKYAYICLAVVILPIFVGGKVYNTLQVVMTVKVFIVLGFCLIVGIFLVDPSNWWKVGSGFLRFGTLPVSTGNGGEVVQNVFSFYLAEGQWPVVALGSIAIISAFAGYAGGGGLGNSLYSNYIRDQGWGMGSRVGAIPSAVGGRNVTLSHLGKAFPPTPENLRRWRIWWKYILTDQWLVWAPGCFVGMALPALLSLEFSQYSPLFSNPEQMRWAQAVISADGMRHAPYFSATFSSLLWLGMLLVGLMVLLPSQMSIVDTFTRMWTDIYWSVSRHARDKMEVHQVKYVYYIMLSLYVTWSFFGAWIFSRYGTPKLMVLVVANLNNLALGVTALHVLWINRTLLPQAVRPRWYSQLGLVACAVFYLGLALLVFISTQLPMLREMLR